MTQSLENSHAGRPDMPSGYGLAPVKAETDLMAWQHVEEQLSSKRNYWISSTRANGRPHAMPVWGVWLDGALYFSTDPMSRKGRNLAANPEVVVHLESGDDVVILEGRVAVAGDPAVLEKADQAYFSKYQFHLAGEQAAAGSVYELRPRKVLAWLESSFPTSATRWKFE